MFPLAVKIPLRCKLGCSLKQSQLFCLVFGHQGGMKTDLVIVFFFYQIFFHLCSRYHLVTNEYLISKFPLTKVTLVTNRLQQDATQNNVFTKADRSESRSRPVITKQAERSGTGKGKARSKMQKCQNNKKHTQRLNFVSNSYKRVIMR